jgi:FMN phosphatase YigB (HAD superfamily)
MSISKNISAIIFDIGNVIIDIDYDVMEREFKKIAITDFRQIVNYTHQDNFFNQYEKGEISTPQFRNILRKYLKANVTDQEIDHAWNSILIHYPPAKFELLKKLRGHYKIFALSNINDLHATAIDQYLKSHFDVLNMAGYFDKAYYSHVVGHRKPEREIYEMVIQNENLRPAETLFIDDKLENTNAAAGLGIQVHHLRDRDSLIALLGK